MALSAAGADGTVYVASEDGNLYALTPATLTLPELKWKWTIGSHPVRSPVVGADGTVYVGSDDNLYALQASC